jgi:methyl coenzyme M reductase alpha subunit
MMFTQYAYLALDLARERTLEAEAYHRYAAALQDRGPGLARRTLARAAIGVSHASASVARRLDATAMEVDALGRRSTTA